MAGEGERESDQGVEGWEGPADGKARLELARLVTARIAELHLTRRELQARSGVSVATIREIEHPKGKRNFGRQVLDALSGALEWPPDYLVRAVYRSSPEAPDPLVQAMMAALAPYLEKIDAIPGLQADVAAIKTSLRITLDSGHGVNEGSGGSQP